MGRTILNSASVLRHDAMNDFVKLRQGSGKVRQGKARKGKDGER